MEFLNDMMDTGMGYVYAGVNAGLEALGVSARVDSQADLLIGAGGTVFAVWFLLHLLLD